MASRRESLQKKKGYVRQKRHGVAPQEREPLLGVVVGQKGVGKTHTSLIAINKYAYGKAKPRRVLIFDVNNEFSQYKTISLSEIKAWADNGKIEVRRISFFKAVKDMNLTVNGKKLYGTNSAKMTLREMANALHYICNNFHDGLLLIEDINKYVSDSLPNDLMGAIVTQRHLGIDVIIHFQTIGKFGHPKIVGNANWLRFHKVKDKVARHAKKFEEYTEPLSICEKLVDMKHNQAKPSDKAGRAFHCYWDAEVYKIKGAFTKAEFITAVRDYMSSNYGSVVKPIISEVDLDTGKLKHTDQKKVVSDLTNSFVEQYYGNKR